MSLKPPPKEHDSLSKLVRDEPALDPDMPPESEAPPEPALPAAPSAEALAEDEPPEVAAATTSSAAAPPPVPEKVLDLAGGRYSLLRQLGKGGMGEVWLARRVGAAGFQRDLAIKRIRADHLADEENVEMYRQGFADEARVLAALHHPVIAQVYDFCEHDDGSFYLIMEYVPGNRTVRDVLQLAERKGCRLTPGFGCYVAARIAEALQCAYNAHGPNGESLRIVHRDVNPANIMLGESGEVKLIDFGIAYSYVENRDRTQTGVVKGKKTYASPEQVQGARDLDNRSDLFVLGIVLAELLTGRRPFDDGDEKKETLISMRIMAAAARDVRAVTRELPHELARIVSRLLAREPDARFENAAELAAALVDYVASTGAPYGAAEAVRELAELERASPTPAASPASPGLSPTRIAKRQATRERLRNPEDPKPRIVKPVLLVLAIAVVVQAVIFLVLKTNRGGAAGVQSAEVVKTPAQIRAAQEAEQRALIPQAARPELANVRDPNAVLTAAAGGVATPPTSTPPFGSAAPGAPSPNAQPNVSPRPHLRRGLVRASVEAGIDPRHRRELDFSSATTFADSPPGSSGEVGSSGSLPKGTLISARLVTPADGTNPGPVSAVVTKDVSVSGSVLIPAGSPLSCATAGAVSTTRVGLTCDGVTIHGRLVALGALALGQDQLRGIPVVTAGGSDAATEPARHTAIDTAGRIAGRVLGGTESVVGDVLAGAVTAGSETARRATAAGSATTQPAPKGTRFLLFVHSFGGAT